MREFAEVKAFDDTFQIYHLPKARVIGKEVRNGGTIGNTAPALWDEVFSSGTADILRTLPHILKDSLYGWTCDYDPQTDTFIYMVCALTPADTPVPDGFTYRDIPETLCAKGLYGEDMGKTLERINDSGCEPNWEPYGWNAELYLDAEEERPPMQVDTPWHWVIPVRMKENQ